MKHVTDYGTFQLSELGCTPENVSDIRHFADRSIAELCEDGNYNLLVFPEDLDSYGEELGIKSVCRLTEKTLETGDVLGFVGFNNTSLTIKSRFAKDAEEDNFLQYMLKEVFSINMFDLKHSVSNDKVFDFLMYLFPYHLKKALQQGLFKQYRTKQHNDANVRGTIDIQHHINKNIPFAGRVAYITREYDYDNHVTQLIRHTIEFIRKTNLGRAILHGKDITSDVRTIIDATPSYIERDRQKVISNNIRPVRHPYFTKYRRLQQLCLQILQHKGLRYGNGDNKVYGLLFSGSWLWEEYLGIVLRKSFKHYYKNKGTRWYLFSDPNEQQIIPDYICWDVEGGKSPIVADAKYIPLGKGNTFRSDEKATAIYYKTITYMYRFKAQVGCLFYPSATSDEVTKLKIGGTGAELWKIALKIPQEQMSFSDFCTKMRDSENNFLSSAIEYHTNT